MYTYSPVMDYQEAVNFLAGRILTWQSENPYLFLINGFSQSGKTHFCRDITGAIGFRKKGSIIEPHNLAREYGQHRDSVYYLLENHDAHIVAVNIETQKILGKNIDFNVFIVNGLAKILSPPEFTLDRMLECFDLIVENPNGKFDLSKYHR